MTNRQMKGLRESLHQHAWLTFAVSLLVLLAGVYLIWRNVSVSTPDPMNGDLGAATQFLSKDQFISLSSARRTEYLNSLGARYVQESPTNRALIEHALKANGVERSTQRSIAIGMLRQILSQYRAFTPEQKRQRIGMLKTFVTAMGFKGPTVSGLDPKVNPVAVATGTEQDFQTGMSSFTRDLLNELSAEERATLSILTKDIREMK